MSKQEQFKKEILKKLIQEKGDREKLRKIKASLAKKFQLDFPKNSELLKTYRWLRKKDKIKTWPGINRVLLTRPVRSLSGIVNVTVLTRPAPCPGNCIFCPTEKGFPKSYLSGEPAADRAAGLDFNPYLQVNTRLSALKAQGHPVDKIELRMVGGTWSAYPPTYRKEFVKECFRAANDFPQKRKEANTTLKQEQKRNEKAGRRIVGLSVETRPDHINKKEIKDLRKLGVTFVEMGVQTVFDEMHQKCNTGLDTKTIARATKLLKDSGLKVLYQVMPDLPGSSLKKDKKMFEILFSDQRFKPDWLKIYPCLVCKNTKLYKEWKKGNFKPYTEEGLTKLLTRVKKDLPRWVRVARIFRDIPAEKIKAGTKTSNIREVVHRKMKKEGKRCNCIRCREVKGRFDPGEEVKLFREDYPASGGKEIFLSFENKKRTKLFSLLRLRITQNGLFPALQKAGIIRELQTFGPLVPLKASAKAPQHKGLGKKLIKEAEKVTKKEFGLSKMAVISGVGVRDYYRKKHDYRLEDTYMVKNL